MQSTRIALVLNVIPVDQDENARDQAITELPRRLLLLNYRGHLLSGIKSSRLFVHWIRIDSFQSNISITKTKSINKDMSLPGSISN